MLNASAITTYASQPNILSFKVNWECPLSPESKALAPNNYFDYGMLSFSYDKDTQTLDWTELSQKLDKTKGTPIDYSMCFRLTKFKATQKLQEEFCKNLSDNDCIQLTTEIIKSITFKKNKNTWKSPFSPYDSLPDLPKRLENKKMLFQNTIKESVKKSCHPFHLDNTINSSLMSDFNVYRYTFLDSKEFIDTFIPQIWNEPEFLKCQNDFLIHFSKVRSEVLSDYHQCKKYASADSCAPYKERYLSLLFHKQLQDPEARWLKNEEVKSCILESNDPIQTFLDLEKEIKKTGDCTPIEIGKCIKVNSSGNRSAYYELCKNEKNEYQVNFNLNFKSDNKKHIKKIKRKVKKCFKIINPWLNGPGGKSLKFDLYDDQETPDTSPPSEHTITIKKTDRENMGVWNHNITCPEITHELLHVAGLADEYNEGHRGNIVDKTTGEVTKTESIYDIDSKTQKQSNIYLQHDCRSTGLHNSIMNNHLAAFILRKDKGSLLLPGHFKVITQPNCKLTNNNYYQCTKNATRTSKNNHGEGCLPDVPAFCNDGSYSWLLDKSPGVME